MAKLCKAGIQLREQVDDAFPDRDRTSDGWIGDKRHSARKSDHNPTAAYSTSVVGGIGYFDGTSDYLSLSSTSLNLGQSTRKERQKGANHGHHLLRSSSNLTRSCKS